MGSGCTTGSGCFESSSTSVSSSSPYRFSAALGFSSSSSVEESLRTFFFFFWEFSLSSPSISVALSSSEFSSLFERLLDFRGTLDFLEDCLPLVVLVFSEESLLSSDSEEAIRRFFAWLDLTMYSEPELSVSEANLLLGFLLLFRFRLAAESEEEISDRLSSDSSVSISSSSVSDSQSWYRTLRFDELRVERRLLARSSLSYSSSTTAKSEPQLSIWRRSI